MNLTDTEEQLLANLQRACAQGLSVELLPFLEKFEIDADVGQRAKLLAVFTEDYPEETVFGIRMDFGAYSEYNKQFEQANFLGAQGGPSLTYSQTEYYNPVDTLFICADEVFKGFAIVEDDVAERSNKLALMFKKEDTKETYMAWLERKLAATL